MIHEEMPLPSPAEVQLASSGIPVMVQFLDHIARDDDRSDSNMACSAGLVG